MEKNYVHINSYAEAEQLGYEPFDTLIGKVVDLSKAPKVVIVAYNNDFMFNDAGKYSLAGQMREFVDRDGYRFFAVDVDALNVLLKKLFTRRPTMTEIKRVAMRSKKSRRPAKRTKSVAHTTLRGMR